MNAERLRRLFESVERAKRQECEEFLRRDVTTLSATDFARRMKEEIHASKVNKR